MEAAMSQDRSDNLLLDPIAQEIDRATHQRDMQALSSALEQCDSIEASLSRSDSIPILHYYRANAHAMRFELSGGHKRWAWREPELEAQIFNLRRAVAHVDFEQLNHLRQCQCLTNLANALNHLGRSVEALENYDKALSINSKFGMALGNRGLARSYFARSLFNKHHGTVGMMLAYGDLRAIDAKGVLWDNPNYKAAQEVFRKMSNWIAERMDVEAMRPALNLDDSDIGRSNSEKAYRSWALKNRLFLNPLNVFGDYAMGAADVLTLPSHHAGIDEPPQYIAWFNQMVQEFVTARLLFCEGAGSEHTHFADREVTLIDTLDYPAFSIAVEKVRLSYRSAYSLLDKMAGFVNHYLALQIEPSKVTIRNLWHDKKALREQFEEKANWHLRGLYWLSRDIADDHDENSQSALAPDARRLKEHRHALEHRCLVLREIDTPAKMGIVETAPLADFEKKTLKLLKLVRAALIHLALAIHREEREHNKSGSDLVVPMDLPIYQRAS
jgi:tetratricopeptide (TPR) repeat protein